MPRGRRTKLTPEVQERIVRALRAGNYFRTACIHAGISEATGYEWLARGRGEHDRPQTPLYAAFAEACARAEADAETRAVAQIITAGRDDWRANAWFLERRRPAEWSPRVRTELSGPDGGPISVASEAAHDALIALLAEAATAAHAQRVGLGLAPGEPGGNGHAPLAPGTQNGGAG